MLDQSDLARISAEYGAAEQQRLPWHRPRPTGHRRGAAPHMFSSLPDMAWQTQLAHQTGHLPSGEECLDTVRNAFAEALAWPEPYDPFA